MISSFRCCIRNTCQRNVQAFFHDVRETSKTREARMLNKMFEKAMRKKKNPTSLSGSLLKGGLLEPDNDMHNRQGAALNKVYMEHMMELIQGGKKCVKILEAGLEISKVKLTKGGQFLNIFWTCSKENLSDEAIAELLRPAIKELQEQMGTMRYVSRTPIVRFVRDVTMERAQNVEKLLKIADFGEDFEPTHPDSVITQDCNISDDGQPEMRQDVLGLNHEKIKAKILTAMEIYKVTHTPKENEFAHVEMENLIPFDKKTFAKFYKRKRILDRKLTSRGLLGWKKSNFVEVEEEDEDEQYANEFWECIKKEQEEEEKEFAEDY